jgi:hypothetical protein
MKIKSIKTTSHLDCPVYIRHFIDAGEGDTFEYLTVINKEIYAFPITMRKSFWKRIFRLPYSADELKKITEYIIAAAYTTIETVKADGKSKGAKKK